MFVTIEVKDPTKRYDSKTVLSHVSFTVEEGTIPGFLGLNGVGKSTTTNTITGYLSANGGEVAVDRQSIPDYPNEVKKKIGYLSELPPLYLDITVEEYLNSMHESKKVSLPREKHIKEICALVKIGDVYSRLIGNLSKGHRQRVSIVQALLGNPPVLILDEPTVGFNPKQIIEIRNLIKKPGDNHAVILSLHIPSEVQTVYKRILVINQGRIVVDGSPDTLSHQVIGNHKLLVRLKGREVELKQGSKTLYRVKEVQPLGEKKPGVFEFAVEGEPGADLRRDPLALASRKGWPILSLRTNDLTPEEVPLRLTDGQAAAIQKEGESA